MGVNDSLVTRNRAKLQREFVVLWDGAREDAQGSRGGLLPGYNSTSSWTLVEEALRTRWEFMRRILAPDDAPD